MCTCFITRCLGGKQRLVLVISVHLLATTVEMEGGCLKHLVIVKFKEEVVVDEIVKGLEKLVSEVDHLVTSFEWGHDLGSEEMLRQGFTHVIAMTFRNPEEFNSYLIHPSHVEFSETFKTLIEKIMLLDFPIVIVKKLAPAA